MTDGRARANDSRVGAGAVRLAPLERRHLDRTLAWVSEPRLARDLGLRGAASPEATEAWFERVQADGGSRPFAILLDEAHVGNVVLDQVDPRVGSARLHIYVGAPESRGRGVGRRALVLVLEHAFEALDLNKVWLTAHAANAPALALYQAVGFRIEGELREEFRLDDRLVSSFRLGILRRDWRAARDRPAGGSVDR
jgi:diamine N-acetyltransferase